MRARNIKPGFFKNELLADCDPMTRLFFIGLWCMADRDGRLEYRPKKMRAELFPYDNCNIKKMAVLLEEKGFIISYLVEGEIYIQINNFTKHQNPHVREQASGIPDTTKASACHCLGNDKALPRSPDSGFLIPDSPSLKPETLIPSSADDEFESFWKAYPRKVGKPEARKAWKKAKGKPSTEKIILAIQRQLNTTQWKKDNGQFIPHPSTWLNQGRWEDEVKASENKPASQVHIMPNKKCDKCEQQVSETIEYRGMNVCEKCNKELNPEMAKEIAAVLGKIGQRM